MQIIRQNQTSSKFGGGGAHIIALLFYIECAKLRDSKTCREESILITTKL